MVMFDVCVGIAVVAGVCVGAIVRFCCSEDNWGLVSMSFPSCVEKTPQMAMSLKPFKDEQMSSGFVSE